DPANCGGCGVACPQGQVCSAGQCSLVCTGGSTKCGGKCVDVQTDPANCGGCGAACAPAQICAAGQCALVCVGGTVKCSGKCVDTQTDAANCGSCDNACPPGQICTAGQCALVCAGGTTKCGNKCVDTQVDPANCGGCNSACGNSEICSAGKCTLVCGGGTTKCGNQCVNTQTDPANCGACNVACAKSEQCTGGKCVGTLKSCKAILDGGKSVGNGLYTIDPNGGDPADAFQTYCDMTTDSGGWTLILNRLVDSDNTGQPNLGQKLGSFSDARSSNWQFNIDLFWADAAFFVWADKENNYCASCPIASYDSAVKLPKPAAPSWSVACGGASAAVTVTKLVGPNAPSSGTAYSCQATLGWGSCGGNVCHYGVHSSNTSSDGSWSSNQWNEMHFPSAYSSYRNYGDYANPPSAWCRSCGGGLAGTLNQSCTCCNVSNQYNARSRWTLWVR
ncbi:MAG: hypothetical protein HY744_17675, partial [Deltaproteobacteria bacterium]|nr:hypothetical protein [Deltaproteobacteria bacterium]